MIPYFTVPVKASLQFIVGMNGNGSHPNFDRNFDQEPCDSIRCSGIAPIRCCGTNITILGSSKVWPVLSLLNASCLNIGNRNCGYTRYSCTKLGKQRIVFGGVPESPRTSSGDCLLQPVGKALLRRATS